MLISVHVPKTAGASFRKSLGDYFGENLVDIYHDRPMKKSRLHRNMEAFYVGVKNSSRKFPEQQCIHGHFLPLKYRWIDKQNSDVQYVTWLREPVERLASLYFFLKRVYNKIESPSDWERRTVEESWSLEQFCLCPDLKIIIINTFGASIDRFDFIGLSEFYRGLSIFHGKILGKPLPVYYENINTARQHPTYEIESQLRNRIEAFHEKDMQLYHKILNERCRS